MTRRLHANGSAIESGSESLLFREIPFANAGLLEIIRRLFDQEGIGYRILADGPRIPPLRPPEAAGVGSSSALDEALLQIVHRRDRTLIRFGQGCRVSSFIEQLARLFPMRQWQS